MEGKDTVMNDEQIIDAQNSFMAEHPNIILRFPLSGWMRESAVLKAQAEISFKAGANEEAKRGIERCALCYEQGKKEGIREVVEWIEKNGYHNLGIYDIRIKDWRAKLKIWGISPEGGEK